MFRIGNLYLQNKKADIYKKEASWIGFGKHYLIEQKCSAEQNFEGPLLDMQEEVMTFFSILVAD